MVIVNNNNYIVITNNNNKYLCSALSCVTQNAVTQMLEIEIEKLFIVLTSLVQ